MNPITVYAKQLAWEVGAVELAGLVAKGLELRRRSKKKRLLCLVEVVMFGGPESKVVKFAGAFGSFSSCFGYITFCEGALMS